MPAGDHFIFLSCVDLSLLLRIGPFYAVDGSPKSFEPKVPFSEEAPVALRTMPG